LSLSQAGYLGLFGITGAIIFIKAPLPFEIKATFALVLVCIGGGFSLVLCGIVVVWSIVLDCLRGFLVRRRI
jgi:hypothetical protein